MKGNGVTINCTMSLSADITSEKVISVPRIVHDGGPFGTVPELLFEKNGLILALKQLLVSYLKPTP